MGIVKLVWKKDENVSHGNFCNENTFKTCNWKIVRVRNAILMSDF